MNKSIGTLITALLILLMAGLAMCATPEPVSVQANDVVKDAITMEPVVIDGHGTGLVIPEALKGSDFVVPEPVSPNLMVGQPPSAWDWRDHGGVTPVKDQGGCGACYAFATLGMIEGDILVDSDTEYDFSEEQSKECIWEAIDGSAGQCNGGWDSWVINLLTRVGIVLEVDDPYHAYDDSCDPSTTPVERVTSWYVLSTDEVPDPSILKGYILEYGPIFTTIYADCLGGYDGSYVIVDGDPYDLHAVVIVGWNDTMQYEGGQGAWICKNSWGTDWGDEGYFYIAYGGAEIGRWSSVMSDYASYDPTTRTESYDDSGWKGAIGFDEQDDAWGLCRFTVTYGEEVTAIEFWTTGSTSDVDLYLYDGFDGSDLGTELWNVTDSSFNEPGYHSVEVDPLVVTDGEIIVVAHITNINSVHPPRPSYPPQLYPIATDYNDPIESEKTYISYDGSDGSWIDLGEDGNEDVALRIRVGDYESKPPFINDVWTEDEDGYYEDCFAAGDNVTVCAVVCDEDGESDLANMIVVANMSAFGGPDKLELTYIESWDGECASYNASTIVTKKTVDWCDDWNPPCSDVVATQVGNNEITLWKVDNPDETTPSSCQECTEFEVNATDPAGITGTYCGCIAVEPGPCAQLTFGDGYGWWMEGEFVPPRSKALTNLGWCVNLFGGDLDEWWTYHLYIVPLGVFSFDEYGNMIECVWECYDGVTMTAELPADFIWCEQGFALVYNEVEPENVTIRAHCINNPDVSPAEHVINFLEPIAELEVITDSEYLIGCGGDCCNVGAQLIDMYGESILMPGVPVDLYVNNYEWGDAHTDENGTAFFDVCAGEFDVGTINIRAEAECKEGNTTIEVLEGPADLTVTCDAEYMVANDTCGDPDNTTVTVQLLNASGLPYMRSGIEVEVQIEYDEWWFESFFDVTLEDGSFSFDLEGTSEACNIWIGAQTICDVENDTSIQVVEPELVSLELVAVEPIMVPFYPGDVQMYEVVCYNQNGDEMCCDSTCCGATFNVGNDSVASWDCGYTYDGLDRRIRNNLTANAIGSTTVNVTCDDVASDDIDLMVIDPCEGVTCEDVCFGYDLWSQICECGVCVNDSLIEENNITVCGYDPCWDVTCNDTVCVGYDLHEEMCVDGVCVSGDLIEADSTECGYDPCWDVTCDDTCVGVDLWSQVCVDGECVHDELIEENCTACGYNPCDNTVEADVPFIVTSGLVSLTGNFTNDGYACIQEIEDPMPESEDDVRGAEVIVSENATLNLTGDGDTWKLTYGESSTYETSPVFQEYEMHQDMPDPDRTTQTDMEAEYNDSLNQSIGLCVESDNAGGDCGYFAEDWFGEAYVAIDGNADEICRLLVEFEDDDKKTLAIGEEWDINSGYSLTASQIDSEGKKVWILFKRDGVLLDDEVIDINKTEQDRVYTYTDDIGSGLDIPVFSFYLDTIGDEFVQLTYIFLIDEEVLVIETSDEYNGMEVMTAGSSIVVLECDGVEEWAFYADGDISEVGNGTYALVHSEPEPEPTPSYRRGGGGGSGGTYPPNWDKPKTTGSSGNATLPPEPEPETEGEDAGIPEPTITADGLLGGGPVGDNGNDTEPTPTPESPGFAGCFAILGFLSVAYWCYRTKR